MLLDSIERWMSVSGYEGTYEVSDHGRVRSLDHTDACGRLRYGRMLHFGGDDYRLVILCHFGHRKMMKVHRLVALAFVQNPDGKPHVNHKDGDTKNNHHSNLEWVTNLENMRHAWRTGLKWKNCRPVNGFRSLRDAAEHAGIEYKTVNGRLKHGWTLEDALTIPVDLKKRAAASKPYEGRGRAGR